MNFHSNRIQTLLLHYITNIISLYIIFLKPVRSFYILLIFSEVLKALLKTRDLFESWKMGDEGRDLRSAEEQEWSTTELRNSLRSIEWDLEVRAKHRL